MIAAKCHNSGCMHNHWRCRDAPANVWSRYGLKKIVGFNWDLFFSSIVYCWGGSQYGMLRIRLSCILLQLVLLLLANFPNWWAYSSIRLAACWNSMYAIRTAVKAFMAKEFMGNDKILCFKKVDLLLFADRMEFNGSPLHGSEKWTECSIQKCCGWNKGLRFSWFRKFDSCMECILFTKNRDLSLNRHRQPWKVNLYATVIPSSANSMTFWHLSDESCGYSMR